MPIFNLNELRRDTVNNNRYERRLAKLVSMNQEVDRIKAVVESAVDNTQKGQKSFVIYGEPQSGKTEMMIALTAKLLDVGFKIVIALLNDSVQLLGQNLERFQRSGLSPSPKKFSENLPYRLTFLPDAGDDPKHLREALFSFIVNVGYLNSIVNDPEKNYSMLVHTSSKKADHTVDYRQIVKTFEVLKDERDSNHETYFKRIWEIANVRYPENANDITKYTIGHIDRNNIVVMNSDKEVNAADNRTATDPTAPFTIVIGGNIISRGVTFNNLLSMFFTRDVKHKLQQDTYIQRARMFGSRNDYLKYFELIIPKSLYLDWQKCFIFHRLSLESRKQNKRSPIWLDGQRITAVSLASIDKENVDIDSGEMSFELFDYELDSIQSLIIEDIKPVNKIKALSELLGEKCLPKYLISYIESFCPLGDGSIAVHEPKSISKRTEKIGEMDKDNIIRSRGFIGKFEREEDKFPDAIHHINILFNDLNRARVFYKYKGDIRFLKTSNKE